MKILLIEDNGSKKTNISDEISRISKNFLNTPVLYYAKDLCEARRHLLSDIYDLIIFDMYLPDRYGLDQERDCSEELIIEFSKSKNYNTEAITLTQFDINEVENIQAFNSAGITLVKYDSDNTWITALEQKLIRASQKVRYDFLIFCALSKERLAFKRSDCEFGKTSKLFGLDCVEVKIKNFHGLIIKPSNMGLVYMAITVTKAIEFFQPKIVGMSGICAGVKGESNYLDILVGKLCWEYQTGKWKDGVFKQEPYQVDVHNDLVVDLEQSQEDEQLLDKIREGLYNSELANMKVRFTPISSGSAVIADEDMMTSIGQQHRKMSGLEMEMYSLYEAAKQSLSRPLFFGAKSVVDMGDSSKADEYHDTACILSARYVTSIISQKLEELSN